MNIRIKNIGSDTYSETRIIDGKTFVYITNEEGELLDILEEVQSSISDSEKIVDD